LTEKMPEDRYCYKCGAPIKKGDVYCSNCGARIFNLTLGGEERLATWDQRFIAFIIDMIILGFIIPLLNLPGYQPMHNINIKLGLNNILEFVYFMLLDYYYGASIGKKALNIRVVKEDGSLLSLMNAAIEAFGKVFLLPLDFIIGFFLYGEKNQRLFNYLSDTLVIRE